MTALRMQEKRIVQKSVQIEHFLEDRWQNAPSFYETGL
jgi:hypothetical protein